VVPELFLAEVHALGLRRVGRERADGAIRQLVLSSRVEVAFGSPEVHAAAVELLATHQDLPISYADAAGIALAQGRGISEAFTLDHHWAACGMTVIGG
jgi:predicted nucleic acid-binding protein